MQVKVSVPSQLHKLIHIMHKILSNIHFNSNRKPLLRQLNIEMPSITLYHFMIYKIFLTWASSTWHCNTLIQFMDFLESNSYSLRHFKKFFCTIHWTAILKGKLFRITINRLSSINAICILYRKKQLKVILSL